MTLRDRIAETMWRADYRRATGKERLVEWADNSPECHNEWLFLADAVIAELMRGLADDLKWMASALFYRGRQIGTIAEFTGLSGKTWCVRIVQDTVGYFHTEDEGRQALMSAAKAWLEA